MTRHKSSPALRERFANLATPRHEDICYATQNRQDAVKEAPRTLLTRWW